MTLPVYLPPRPSLEPRCRRCILAFRVPDLHDVRTSCRRPGPIAWPPALGLALIAADTSPGRPRFAGDPEGAWTWHGAGFISHASEPPWARHYRMPTTWCRSLRRRLLERELPSTTRRGISGPFDGGHGAFVCGTWHPRAPTALSRHSPNQSHPSRCKLGREGLQSFTSAPIAPAGVPGIACELIASAPQRLPLLIRPGTRRSFLEKSADGRRIWKSAQAAATTDAERRQPGYNTATFFNRLASFDDNAGRHHAVALPCVSRLTRALRHQVGRACRHHDPPAWGLALFSHLGRSRSRGQTLKGWRQSASAGTQLTPQPCFT